jgi:uncharacterized tellurite resistance protein B-like protein
MTRRARDTFTGVLRPNDPRRFLVEAMLGAMGADGKIHEAEVASLQRHLEEHEIFSGLTERHHAVLLEIARDAISFASSPLARIPAIAKGLPSRLHKLTALSMACEVVVADTFVEQSEVRYLKALHIALRIAADEFEEMFLAAREQRSARDLDARVAHLREIVPSIVELFALRSLAVGTLTPAHRAEIATLLAVFPDLELRDRELATLVEKVYARMHFSMDLEASLGKIADSIASLGDRYWATVYVMCADTKGAALWRSSSFLTLVQRAFRLRSADLDLAANDAAGFASILPRVG